MNALRDLARLMLADPVCEVRTVDGSARPVVVVDSSSDPNNGLLNQEMETHIVSHGSDHSHAMTLERLDHGWEGDQMWLSGHSGSISWLGKAIVVLDG